MKPLTFTTCIAALVIFFAGCKKDHLFLYNGLVAADGTVTEYEKIKSLPTLKEQQ
jgi:hypothetical protein